MAHNAERSIDEIRAEMAANRFKLASATSEAFDSIRPSTLARNSVNGAKNFVKAEVNTAFGHFRRPDGSLRVDRLLMIGGAVVGAVALVVTLNAVGNRRLALTAQVRGELER